MNVRIYQVNFDRDTDHVAFMGSDFLQEHRGAFTVDSSIYDKVFDGEVSCDSLEDVFRMFNLNHPKGYIDRSLSVSDVVEITKDGTVDKGFYFCDSVGFKPVAFDPQVCGLGRSLTQAEEKNKISVLLVEPGRYPKMIEIGDSLEDMQAVVEGDIEEYMPFEDEVAIICNEESKINGLPLNRAVYSEDRKILDIICGRFFICYAPVESEKFLSMPKELAKKYADKFKYPERFYQTADGIIAKPYKPISKDMER